MIQVFNSWALHYLVSARWMIYIWCSTLFGIAVFEPYLEWEWADSTSPKRSQELQVLRLYVLDFVFFILAFQFSLFHHSVHHFKIHFESLSNQYIHFYNKMCKRICSIRLTNRGPILRVFCYKQKFQKHFPITSPYRIDWRSLLRILALSFLFLTTVKRDVSSTKSLT